MSTLLAKNIRMLVTMDDTRREIERGAIYVTDTVITAVGTLDEMPAQTADLVLDLSRHVVLPGMINTHHHMFQSLTRCIAQDHELFDWLVTLYPIWTGLRAEHITTTSSRTMSPLTPRSKAPSAPGSASTLPAAA